MADYKSAYTGAQIDEGIAKANTALQEMPAHTHTAAQVGAAPAVESTTYAGCYYRSFDGAIEWINPPMELDVEYRTADRWQGAPVYVKAVDFGALPDTATKSVSHGIESLDTIVSADGYAHATSSNTFQTIPLVSNSGVVTCKMHMTATVLVVIAFVDLSHYTGRVVLRYTKSAE